MSVKNFLYWFRDNPARELKTDVEWATARFKAKFNYDPSLILVNPDEVNYFSGLGLKIEPDSKIAKGYLGLE